VLFSLIKLLQIKVDNRARRSNGFLCRGVAATDDAVNVLLRVKSDGRNPQPQQIAKHSVLSWSVNGRLFSANGMRRGSVPS
jgi:hypothetical protein